MNSNDFLNLAISLMFLILGVMMLIRWYRQRGKIKIPDVQWSVMRIMFIVVGSLSVVALFVSAEYTILDYFRIFSTVLAVTAYLLCRDGIGDDGFYVNGMNFSWKDLRGWDYAEGTRNVTLYFQMAGKSASDIRELRFENKKKEELMNFMQTKLKNKYTRMKKTGK